MSNRKRETLDFAIHHLVQQASAPPDEIALPAGSPFGTLVVDASRCTLCKSCIGACPSSALQDAEDAPKLRFIERNCVQCGLCETTCPEQAISLVPRLLVTPAARQPVTLNEAEPFHCVRCGTPFGTRQMIDVMTGRLSSASDVRRSGAAAHPDVRRLSRDRHDGSEERNLDLRRQAMSATNATMGVVLEPEDEGRMQLYALLARLFAAGPDEGLLRALAQSAGSVEGDGELAQAWNDLAAAAGHTSARDATLEFDETFIGVGKAPVSTYLSHYHPGPRKEAVLVELRDTLVQLGLARTAASAEPEDNLTAVLEVMRHLVAAGSDEKSLQRQQEFFVRYLEPVYRGFCDAAHKADLSDFYKAAVRTLEAFMASDLAQFEMG